MCSDYYRDSDVTIFRPRNVHLPKIELSELDFGTLLVRTGNLIDSNSLRKLVCCCRLNDTQKETIGDDPLKLFEVIEKLDRIGPRDFSYLALVFERCQLIKLLNDFNRLALALYRDGNPDSRASQLGYDGVSIVHKYVNTVYSENREVPLVPEEEDVEPGYEVPQSVVHDDGHHDHERSLEESEEEEDSYYSSLRQVVQCEGQLEKANTSRYDHLPPPPPAPPREEKYEAVDDTYFDDEDIYEDIPHPPQTAIPNNEKDDEDDGEYYYIHHDEYAQRTQGADGVAEESPYESFEEDIPDALGVPTYAESTRRRFSLGKISSKLFGRKGSLQFNGKP